MTQSYEKYVADPTNPLTPEDGDPAGGMAAELRAMKSLMAQLQAGTLNTVVTASTTVLSGPSSIDSSGYSCMVDVPDFTTIKSVVSEGGSPAVRFTPVTSAKPLRVAFTQGYNNNGKSVLVRNYASIPEVQVPASVATGLTGTGRRYWLGVKDNNGVAAPFVTVNRPWSGKTNNKLRGYGRRFNRPECLGLTTVKDCLNNGMTNYGTKAIQAQYGGQGFFVDKTDATSAYAFGEAGSGMMLFTSESWTVDINFRIAAQWSTGHYLFAFINAFIGQATSYSTAHACPIMMYTQNNNITLHESAMLGGWNLSSARSGITDFFNYNAPNHIRYAFDGKTGTTYMWMNGKLWGSYTNFTTSNINYNVQRYVNRNGRFAFNPNHNAMPDLSLTAATISDTNTGVLLEGLRFVPWFDPYIDPSFLNCTWDEFANTATHWIDENTGEVWEPTTACPATAAGTDPVYTKTNTVFTSLISTDQSNANIITQVGHIPYGYDPSVQNSVIASAKWKFGNGVVGGVQPLYNTDFHHAINIDMPKCWVDSPGSGGRLQLQVPCRDNATLATVKAIERDSAVASTVSRLSYQYQASGWLYGVHILTTDAASRTGTYCGMDFELRGKIF